MFYPEDVIEDIRSANDIVDVISGYTSLKKKGANYFGLCPFHKENTPSFSVSADKQMYYCFGCGAGGNVYSFIMQKENLDFSDSVRFLADKAHYSLPEGGFSRVIKQNAESKNILYEIHISAARFFYNLLISDSGKKAVEYLDDRGVSPAARKKFGLGFSSKKASLFNHLLSEGFDIDNIIKSGLIISDKNGNYFDRFANRLMFPIFNVQNKIIGFGGRILDSGQPKYLNSPDTLIFDKSRNLYSLNFARKANVPFLIIVEGYMDVISLFQNGIKNVVASLGTAFNVEHAKLIKKHCDSVVLLFDSDSAGEKAAMRAIPILLSAGLGVKVLQLEGAKDPDEYIKSFGRQAFIDCLSNAVSHVSFRVGVIKKGYDISDPEQNIRFTNETAKLIAELDNEIERDVYIKETSQLTGITSEAIKKEVGKLVQRDGLGVVSYKNKPNTYSKKDGSKGADEARRNIIYIISTNSTAAKAIKACLPAEEMSVPFYIRLYNLIYEMYEKKQAVYPAEIINHFESLEEQKMISNIFTLTLSFEDDVSLIKALNDQIRVIKTSYIDEKLMDSVVMDAQELQKLAEIKRNLKKSYITGLDG